MIAMKSMEGRGQPMIFLCCLDDPLEGLFLQKKYLRQDLHHKMSNVFMRTTSNVLFLWKKTRQHKMKIDKSTKTNILFTTSQWINVHLSYILSYP